MKIRNFISHREDVRARRFQNSFHMALRKLSEDRRVEIFEHLSRIGVNYSGPLIVGPGGNENYEDVAAENIRRIFDFSQPIMGVQGLRSALVAFFDCVNKDRQFWSVLFANNSTESIRAEFFRHAWQAALQKPPGQSLLPMEVSISLVVSRTVELMRWWLSEPDPLPIEQVAELLDEVVVSPLVMIDIEG